MTINLPAEFLIELVVIGALYNLFNLSKVPKYEMIYGTMVLLLGPANYLYFGFGKIGFFHFFDAWHPCIQINLVKNSEHKVILK